MKKTCRTRSDDLSPRAEVIDGRWENLLRVGSCHLLFQPRHELRVDLVVQADPEFVLTGIGMVVVFVVRPLVFPPSPLFVLSFRVLVVVSR